MTDNDIFALASERGVDPLALRCQLMLHLPRLIEPTEDDIRAEINIHCDRLASKNPHNILKPPDVIPKLKDCEFGEVPGVLARIYYDAFHYVGYRPGRHFALLDPASGVIVCTGSIAQCDLQHVLDKLDIEPELVITFTRFFAPRWAPHNTLSYFVGLLCRKLRQEYNTNMLVTFINPNMGFDGRSFKGASFEPFALEEGTQYMYFDGQYRTMRYFVENYGTSDPIKLKAKLGDSFSMNTNPLEPMQIWARPLTHYARKQMPEQPYLLKRPTIGG